jgi:hypothetical protein
MSATTTSKQKQAARSARWYRANRVKAIARAVEWNRKHAGRRRVICANWQQSNPEKMRGYYRTYDARHPEKVRAKKAIWAANNVERRRELMRLWSSVNSHRMKANARRREARMLNQLHPEHDIEAERQIHRECEALSKATGVIHHVDHIIPLARGGWHHHQNMQILPGALNIGKHHDPFWTHPSYKSWRDVPEFLWPEALVAQYHQMKAIAA